MDNPFELLNQKLDRIEKLLQNLLSGETASANSQKVLNIQQLSDYVGISKSHIYKLTSARLIPHSKKGKLIYFDKDLIDIWFLENKVKTEEEIMDEAISYSLRNQKFN